MCAGQSQELFRLSTGLQDHSNISCTVNYRHPGSSHLGWFAYAFCKISSGLGGAGRNDMALAAADASAPAPFASSLVPAPTKLLRMHSGWEMRRRADA